MNSIKDIKYAFYINLDSRPDRREHIEKQLSIVGIHAERFSAIQQENGAIGCSMSHLKCLKIAQQNNWEHILIMEDDIEFLNPELFKNQLNKFFKKNIHFDVLLIAGNNLQPFVEIDDCCVKIHNCQTTTGYIVQKHYYDTFINNYQEGIINLIKNKEKHVLFALDQYWKNLQKIDEWYLIIPPTIRQKEGYSDIEKKHTNYSRAMLSIH